MAPLAVLGLTTKNHSLWTKSIEIGPGISMPKFFGPRPSQKPKPPRTRFSGCSPSCFFSPATVRRVD